jgi:integrase/recombinase XerD
MARRGDRAVSAPLRELAADYLRVRRSLGYKLTGNERILAGLLDYLDERGADTLTVEHAVGFAITGGGSARRQALRLSAVRCFARWAQPQDPAVQVPAARLLPARPTRSAPYIYTGGEVAALLSAARQLRPPMKAATFAALVALMAATGIRTGEAIGLDVTGLDEHAATLTVTGKYGKVRMLPLHPTVLGGLTGYLQLRRRLLPASACPALLVSTRGCRLIRQTVHATFRQLADAAGLHATSSASRPRLYDLRHSFAVSVMLDAYRSGSDPAAVLPVLATWMGHADPNDTYWYLTGTAELLAAATERLQALGCSGRPEGGRS